MKLFEGNTINVLEENTKVRSSLSSVKFIQSFKCEPGKEGVNLIELPNHRYVCEGNVKSRLDLLRLFLCAIRITPNDNRILGIEPNGIGSYVDEDSLKEVSKKIIKFNGKK